jgi:hypothetical protein
MERWQLHGATPAWWLDARQHPDFELLTSSASGMSLASWASSDAKSLSSQEILTICAEPSFCLTLFMRLVLNLAREWKLKSPHNALPPFCNVNHW